MNIPDFWGDYLKEKERIKRSDVVLCEEERFNKQNQTLVQLGLKDVSCIPEAFNFQSGINFFKGSIE